MMISDTKSNVSVLAPPGWLDLRGREAGFITPAERAYLELENRLPDYKPTDEDKDEKELEKEEDESEADEPGKYQPLSIADKKSSPKSKKGRRKPKSLR
jgi:hypothetical protein